MALTKKRIDSFKWDGRSRDIRWDGKDGVPFFGVRCNPGGSKTFMVEYRLPGNRKKTLYSIGGCRERTHLVSWSLLELVFSQQPPLVTELVGRRR